MEQAEMTTYHQTATSTGPVLQPTDVLPKMEKAVEFHRNGQKEEARTRYEQVLNSFPDHPDALHLLGVIENETGNYKQAVFLINAAIKLTSEKSSCYSNLGNAFRGLGRVEKAIACYQKSIEINPYFHEAYYNLAIAYRQNDQLDCAEALIRDLLELIPHWSEAWCLLGDILNETGEIDGSVACFKRALEINPDLEQAWFYIGNSHRLRKEQEKAISCYQRALSINSDFAECLNNLGLIFSKTGKLSQAIKCYSKTIQLQPTLAEAHYNMGNALNALGLGAQAMACYQKALDCKPDFFEAAVGIGNLFYENGELYKAMQWFNKSLAHRPFSWEVLEQLGNTVRLTGDIDSALAYYKRALEIKPDAYKVFISIGNTYRTLKRMDQAIASYRKALEYNPTALSALNNLGLTLMDAGKTEEAVLSFDAMLAIRDDFSTRVKRAMTLPIIYPSRISMLEARKKFADRIRQLGESGQLVEDPYHDIGIANFILALHGCNEKPIREMIAAFYLKICPELEWNAPNLKRKKRKEKIKLGILCRYLHDHTIGRLYQGIIEKLDKEKFQLFIFRFEPHEDNISRSIDHCAEKVEFLPKDIQKARERIGSHELDVLFYPEIGMDPLTYFIAFSRLAPVQIKRGFQITMGIPSIDYFISSDAAEPPNAQQYYSERLIRLKGTGYYYRRPQTPAQLLDRASFGLPEGRTLYVCTQSLFKFHPDFDTVLAAVVEADPNGMLVLLEGLHPWWKRLLLQRLEKVIPGAQDRVCFVARQPRKEFMNLHLLADAVLDTIYFSGGHTSLECFAWGIPVVTWPSAMLPGRLTYGFYRLMEVMDCVAKDQTSYLAIAYRLANDPGWRQAVGRKIKERSRILFENSDDVVELETFLENAVDIAYTRQLVPK